MHIFEIESIEHEFEFAPKFFKLQKIQSLDILKSAYINLKKSTIDTILQIQQPI